jgi:hypothetical protein
VDWNDIIEMSNTWRPLELELRQKARELRNYVGEVEGIMPLHSEFVKILEKLEVTIGPMNKKLIDQMSRQLAELAHGTMKKAGHSGYSKMSPASRRMTFARRTSPAFIVREAAIFSVPAAHAAPISTVLLTPNKLNKLLLSKSMIH